MASTQLAGRSGLRPEYERLLAIWGLDPAKLRSREVEQLPAVADWFDRYGAGPWLAHLPEGDVGGLIRWCLREGRAGTAEDVRVYITQSQGRLPTHEPADRSELRAKLDLEARHVLFALHLRQLCHAAGVSREALAARLGKDPVTIYRELKGEQLPDEDSRGRLCEIFRLGHLGPHEVEVEAYVGYVSLYPDDLRLCNEPPWQRWLAGGVADAPPDLTPYFLNVLAYAALRWVRLGPGALRRSNRDTLDAALRLIKALPVCGARAAAAFSTTDDVLMAAERVAARLNETKSDGRTT